MRKVKLYPLVVSMVCPHCHENVEEPKTGSYMWETKDVVVGHIVKCQACGEVSRIPNRMLDQVREV